MCIKCRQNNKIYAWNRVASQYTLSYIFQSLKVIYVIKTIYIKMVYYKVIYII